MTEHALPTIDDVRAAAERIRPHVHRTPVFTSRLLDERVGTSVYAKAENHQKIGAFKARGALNAVLSLDDASRAAGIATHSSGNHAQAVAYAAALVDVPATIVMPDHAPSVKVEAVRALGASIVTCRQDQRERILADVVSRSGATVVHPYDDPSVVAGQGTATLELLEEVTDLDVVVTPIGGGGLLTGATLVAADAGLQTIGAEPSIVDDAHRSLRDGVRHPPTGAISVGDGLLTGTHLLAIAADRGVPISDLSDIVRLPQVLLNVPVSRKPPLEELPRVAAVLAEANRRLDQRGRVLLRYSGTERLARVMIEGEDADELEALAESIAEAIRVELS